MMTVVTKKATRTKGQEEDDDKPGSERGHFVDKADRRGDDRHRGVMSCLNIINDDLSINASFSFNTI
jgi:hypothetical protein